ncbi:pentatricopeptide repeat-containing protein 1, mitochondrial isoform X2 [Galleria mellonella]|uniref:Pentatricopeptide repeat-containing protein 1, mitochondrial isoform X2 n=1 Tax=Galleria mellonella TaxID=7137 RepID=A0A6J1X7D3_GALME|nr:pentatricopeptide repeat-containing protein 1, mitochondrial isoform X2 [Galleria mellonella]
MLLNSCLPVVEEKKRISNLKEYKTEKNFLYLEDPDTFGTLSLKSPSHSDELQDESDIKEEQYLQNLPLKSQKLTIKQYADLIKQYLKYNRLKEAIDVLEVRMLTQDRVKPENYIYNILIGACAEVGFTKKAFKLYNDMKRRALKPTGDTYTCLFVACANSPWPSYGLKNARHLRSLMIEKGIEPNLTNYNSMIKAFGRCGDISEAFKIVDEMVSKKIKIRVHTYNHLLHACISDKNLGLRHALIVWRRMLKSREKPNIYSFNLMLKCVKECNLGTKEDIEELIGIIQNLIDVTRPVTLQIESKGETALSNNQNSKQMLLVSSTNPVNNESSSNIRSMAEKVISSGETVTNSQSIPVTDNKQITIIKDDENITLEFVGKLAKPATVTEKRTVPNLLSKVLQMKEVLALQEIGSTQEKFAVLGGMEDFLKEMKEVNVTPDIKIFTQMLPLIEESREAEMQLIDTMKGFDIRADIDFYNMLIKKRCLRCDYDGAFDIEHMIDEENKFLKKKYPLKKKLRLKRNIMTYGVLAMACKTKEHAEKLLNEMKSAQIKINIEILGTLLRHGTAHARFSYVVYVMNIVKEENVKINDIFLKHLEEFNDKCSSIIQSKENKQSDTFVKSYEKFSEFYKNWLKDLNVEEALKPEHPWLQFQVSYPDTIQHQNIKIVEPKKFYKRNKKYVEYKVKN